MSPERHGPTRDELLDHDADGIHEFDNALPRWWLYGFYFTIAFAVAYMLNYHVLATPLVGKPGMIAEYQAEVLAAEALAAARGPAPAATAVATVALTDAASLEKGKAIFEGPDNVCSSCHRPDLGGLVGPNLTDDYWVHGGRPSEVYRTITEGVPEKGMVPWKTQLSPDEIAAVTAYIGTLRGTTPPNPKPPEGQKVAADGSPLR